VRKAGVVKAGLRDGDVLEISKFSFIYKVDALYILCNLAECGSWPSGSSLRR
jgi:hypothetical protein